MNSGTRVFGFLILCTFEKLDVVTFRMNVPQANENSPVEGAAAEPAPVEITTREVHTVYHHAGEPPGIQHGYVPPEEDNEIFPIAERAGATRGSVGLVEVFSLQETDGGNVVPVNAILCTGSEGLFLLQRVGPSAYSRIKYRHIIY